MTTPTRAAALADLDSAVIPDWMAAQIVADAAAGRFARWGRSTVVDEGAGAPVLSRELFDELHEIAGLHGADIAWPVGNAGLLHVYGYLLSTAETPFGRKRDRWVDGGVARAFGLPADAFAPWFETPSAADSTPLERILALAEPFVADPADGDFTVLWIDETGESGADATDPDANAAAGEAIASVITLARTVVISDDDSGATALLYAVGPVDAPLLVTLFPLQGFDAGWLERAVAGQPRLRYNAVDERNVASAPLVDREVMLRNF
ncbi:amino acid deaminase [Conyzicola sp.]|uniref:amino acid deaminase n=1 Tax=Conyzicola sp. TaxID=1969404 RepID=UPI003989A356